MIQDSSIIDFYPEDFAIDLNGKKYAWQGVALLPFVDERRLRAALEEVYPDLTPEETRRNSLGGDVFFVGKCHPLHDFILELYQTGPFYSPFRLHERAYPGPQVSAVGQDLSVGADGCAG